MLFDEDAVGWVGDFSALQVEVFRRTVNGCNVFDVGCVINDDFKLVPIGFFRTISIDAAGGHVKDASFDRSIFKDTFGTIRRSFCMIIDVF